MSTSQLNAAVLNDFVLNGLTDEDASRMVLYVGGADYSSHLRRQSMTINPQMNGNPGTCSFTSNVSIARGTSVLIGIYDTQPWNVVFGGQVINVTQTHDPDQPTSLIYKVTCMDRTLWFNKRRPFGSVSNDASLVIKFLITNYAPLFTAVNVQPNLGFVSMVFDGTMTLSQACVETMQRVGGQFFVDYNFDAHAFILPDGDSLTIDSSYHPIQLASEITHEQNAVPVRTRTSVRGHGEETPCAVSAADTIIPLKDTSWFRAGAALPLITSDAQKLTYTDVTPGGVGTIVGPSVVPTSAPTGTVIVGAGVDTGNHKWAYTWVTAAGETLPSPLLSLDTGPLPTPSSAPSANSNAPTSVTTDHVGDSISYKYSFSAAATINDFTKESDLSAASNTVTVQAIAGTGGVTPGGPYVSSAMTTDSRIKWLHIWKSVNGGAYVLAFVNSVAGLNIQGDINSTSGGTSLVEDVGTGSAPPTAAALNQVSLAGVLVGPSGVTSRKIYRTVAGGSQLKLEQTLANNTATTGTATASDASLGANAPVTDTSGLTVTDGNVIAGSTSLLVPSTSGFPTSGWLVMGSQFIRYTGVTASTFIGIPASGIGAIVAVVKYGQSLASVPSLTGVTGLGFALLSQTLISIYVTANDTVAQARVAAAEGGGSDGIIENVLTNDSYDRDQATAAAAADLALGSPEIKTFVFYARDPKLRLGQTLNVNLTSDGIVGTYVVQSLVITQLDVAPGVYPLYQVTASTVRQTLESVFQRILQRIDRIS